MIPFAIMAAGLWYVSNRLSPASLAAAAKKVEP
jgi:hypothetical protein